MPPTRNLPIETRRRRGAGLDRLPPERVERVARRLAAPSRRRRRPRRRKASGAPRVGLLPLQGGVEGGELLPAAREVLPELGVLSPQPAQFDVHRESRVVPLTLV